jgi:hypothetical protein
MCKAAVVENRIVETVGQVAAILGDDAIVRWDPDNPFDDRLHEYGPHIPQPEDCLCRLDVEATVERARYIASVAPGLHWVFTKKPPSAERRALQWLRTNAWVFFLVFLALTFYHLGLAPMPEDVPAGIPSGRWDPHGFRDFENASGAGRCGEDGGRLAASFVPGTRLDSAAVRP